jgi:hypothetical protein
MTFDRQRARLIEAEMIADELFEMGALKWLMGIKRR